MEIQRCRHCGSELRQPVIDLGHQPPSNAYLDHEQLLVAEVTYPLKVLVCTSCWLVQLPVHAEADELFTDDYAYFSSTSSSWCKHAKNFVEQAIKDLSLNSQSMVVELASNDGYLLQYINERNIPCVGIEPTHATAEAARAKGIKTIEEFFGEKLARELEPADLIIANNVIAHVPDINDFVAGIAKLMKPKGRASIEFPHLLQLLEKNQFDTIYHEHFSYLSLRVLKRIVEKAGLEIFDVELLATHGGSLRVWMGHKGCVQVKGSVQEILKNEKEAKLEILETYNQLELKAIEAKHALLEYLLEAKRNGRKILGLGAAAKGNTFLNYAGIKGDLLEAVGDSAVSKQGKYLPGSHIRVVSPESILKKEPDELLILPWNLIDEFRKKFPRIKMTTAIPSLKHWRSDKGES